MAIEFGCRTWAARILLFCVPLLLHNPAEALLSEPYCPLFNCGGVNITYPFWVLPSTPAINATFCGYRDLNLTCDSHNASKPTLRTNFGNYTVKNFNGTVRTVALLNRVAGDDHCPIVQHNFTLQGAGVRELQYGQEVLNLTFFYNCSEKISTEIPEEHHIRCFSGGGNLSYVFIDTAVNPTYSELYSKCQPPLIAPVMRSLVDGKTLSKAFPGALKEGFQLKSMHEAFDNCEWCEMSQGYCGGNDRMAVDSDFFCFCEDGQKVPGNCTTRVPTDGKHKKTNWKIIGPAVAAPSALVVVLTLVLIFYRRRYKTKRSGSQSKLMRSASSESYSTEKDVEGLSSLTHKFTYGELEEATEGFKESNELGDGGFGTVYKGKLRDGRVVAVKRLYENNFKRAEQFINEVAILNRLRHKNLVSLYGCTSRHSRGLLLVYEYVPNGTVADHLHGPRVEEGALTWPVRMSIAIETAGALAYLHAVEPPIIHRDIKTNNILLDENFHVKVADFGLSRLFPPDATHVSTVPQGTPGYLDPEYHQCYQLTDKSDVYSFGVVLAELISSKPAVDISRKRNEINLANLAISRIQNCRLQELVDPLLGYDSDDVVRNMIGQVAELAFRCLQAEKEMRPSMEEVVEVLKGITGATGPGREHSRGKVERDVKKNTEDCSLLNDSVQYSPDTVHEQWVSTKTTPNTSGQASM